MSYDIPRFQEPDKDPTGVRELLSSLPDPGPMPDDLVERISARLADEQTGRARSGGFASNVVPLRSKAGMTTRRAVFLAAAAAGVAIAGVVGVNILLNAANPNDRQIQEAAARIGTQAPTSAAPTTPAATAPSTPIGPLRITLSDTLYTAAGLPTQLDAVRRSAPSLRTLSPEAPSIGPIATEAGVRGCLTALGVSDAATFVDLGRYADTPVAVIVTSSASGEQARIVARSCGGAEPAAVLHGPVALP